MKSVIPLLMAMMPAVNAAQAQPAASPSGLPAAAIPKTTAVFVIETPSKEATVQKIMAIMPTEIDATVRLYLDGKILQWYSRGDGKGVVFLLNVTSEDEAHALMETLPLAKANLMDHQYIPVGPLMPLRMLVGQ